MKRPKHLFLHLTNKCNLECMHCYLECGRKNEELSLNKIKEIIKEASDIGVEKIHFDGGEPLLREDFSKILNYTDKFSFKTSMVTNGTNINEAILEKMKGKIDFLNYSIDGYGKIHDKIRGKEGLFSKNINAIRKTIEEGINVNVWVTVNKLNRENAIRLIDFFEGFSLSKLAFFHLAPKGRALKNGLNMSSNSWDKFCSRIRKRGAGSKINILYEPARNLGENFCRVWEKDFCHIDPEGEVYFCPLFMNTEKSLGNIKNEKIIDIWRDKNKWREYENWYKSRRKGCERCKNFEKCKGGCIGYSYLFNELKNKDPRCKGREGKYPGCITYMKKIS